MPKGVNGDLRDEYRLVAAANHPKAQKLLDFWEARPADGIVIGRDVPSRTIAAMLNNIIIYEPVNGGSDLKVRLAGTSIRRRFNREVTGMLMSELFPPDEFREHLEMTLANIEAGPATIVDSHLTNGAVEKMHLEVVILPVFAPDRVHKWVLVGLFYFD
jgi:hypothetical protein